MLLTTSWSVSKSQDAQKTELRFRGGMIFGLNASQVDGDDYAGYHKLGINGGFLAQIPLSKKFFISTEILYSQKGAKSRTIMGQNVAYRVNLNYSEIPVLINFQEKTSVNFGVGVAYARLLKAREWLYDLETVPQEEFNKSDLLGVVNGTYLISNHFQLGVRFEYSFFPMGHSPVSNFEGRSMYNNLLSFRMAYVF